MALRVFNARYDEEKKVFLEKQKAGGDEDGEVDNTVSEGMNS